MRKKSFLFPSYFTEEMPCFQNALINLYLEVKVQKVACCLYIAILFYLFFMLGTEKCEPATGNRLFLWRLITAGEPLSRNTFSLRE